MVPVLGRVASGMWQVARAELQQDLDSPQTGLRSVLRLSLADVRDAPVAAFWLGNAGLNNTRTQWWSLSARIGERSNAEPHCGTGSMRRRRGRTEVNNL